MKQYIDKDTLVAEIERIKKEECPTDTYEGRCKLFWIEQFLSFLDTLEVKEVDLDEEIDRVWDNTSDNFSEDGWKEFEDIAKHFFELGLKAQKG